MTWRAPTWPNVRDGILFFSGLIGIAYETFFRRPPDYGLLPVFAAMLGLPAFLKRDEASKDELDDGSTRPGSDPKRLPGGDQPPPD